MSLDVDQYTRHLFLSAVHGTLSDAAEEGEELFVDDLYILFDQLCAYVLRSDLHQLLDELHTVLLFLEHFRRNAVFAEDGFDHGFIGQVRLGLEQIPLAFLGREAIHHLLDERTDHPFLFIDGQSQLGGEEGQQEFLVIIVIHHRSRKTSLITTILAAGKIDLSA